MNNLFILSLEVLLQIKSSVMIMHKKIEVTKKTYRKFQNNIRHQIVFRLNQIIKTFFFNQKKKILN